MGAKGYNFPAQAAAGPPAGSAAAHSLARKLLHPFPSFRNVLFVTVPQSRGFVKSGVAWEGKICIGALFCDGLTFSFGRAILSLASSDDDCFTVWALEPLTPDGAFYLT